MRRLLILCSMLLVVVWWGCGKDDVSMESSIAEAPPAPEAAQAATSPEIPDPCVLADFDTPPTPVHSQAADYPEVARLAEDEGVVQVLVTIDEEGTVTDARVQSSDASQALQDAAVVAARQWTFKPALADGEPVAVRIVIPFKFQLK